MSTSSDDQPTRVLPQAAPAQPSAVAAPATRRSPTWHERVPSHIWRARTSTVVLSGLFVVLFVLNLFLPSQDSGTRTITTSDGETLEVPCTVVECDEPTTPPTPETPVPVVPTSPVPPDDGEDEEPVSTPSRTTPRAPTPTPTPTRTPSPTSTPTRDETTEAGTTEPEATSTADETTPDPTD
ncbi:hypothetical protein O2V63_15025 [Modestobacter sp. VKM Ac-2977]|uniref:hypothetical protein n=1 Tax=Modestobacter sp. VKM Ac-2977 TaxID=3004131 RepID=UPI0022AAE1D0|nr:hypothetical protein [Modestobacter sp. VKM Ac-2977]MCZ2821656.1 hypothetical protein [Modestobacter sp. VKM Ac-2977]